MGRSSNGSNEVFAVVRYNPDGSLDTTFDGDGKVTTAVLSSGDSASSVAIQTDGKIVVGGRSNSGSKVDFALVRYNPDGSLDTTFDGDGKVTTTILSSSTNEDGKSVAIQPDGKIVLGGFSHNGSNYDFAVVRYNADGSLDTSFSGDGKLTTAVLSADDYALSVAILPDGKIVAAGGTHNSSNDDFALVRYNADGSLDTTFDGDGKVTTAVRSFDDIAYSLAIQPDEKIVVGGESSNGANYDFAVVRYNTDGSLDTTFDGDGKVTTAVLSGNDSGYSIALQPDGKIVAAGISYNGSNNDFAIVRYNGDAPCTPSISGTITYGNAISGPPPPRFVSNVLLSGVGSPNVSALTDGFGAYTLTGFGAGSYTVTPTKTGTVNGITSFDAARIAQHAAGINVLTGNPLIVADTSNNGTVSSFDAAKITQYVSGLATVQPNVTGIWRFIPVNRSYGSVTSNVMGEDFVALLMGEVSGNWVNATPTSTPTSTPTP